MDLWRRDWRQGRQFKGYPSRKCWWLDPKQWEGEVWSGCEDTAEVGIEIKAKESERFGAIGRRVALGTEIQNKGK